MIIAFFFQHMFAVSEFFNEHVFICDFNYVCKELPFSQESICEMLV